MPDTIGAITVPEVAASGTFPLTSDFGYGYVRAPEIASHQLLSANGKITQRFLLGDGLRRYTVLRRDMDAAEFESLRDFWEDRSGPYEPFTYNAPSDDSTSTTAVTVRFDNAPLTFQHLSAALISTGLTLVEVPDPSTAPTYTVSSTVTRFPSVGLASALLSQVQVVIPLVKITVREAGYDVIYLSDRRCTVGGQLYQARLLRWDGISQGMNGEADDAVFVFGNADRVMRDLANDTDLQRARVEFSIYHVGSQIKLDLWTGEVIDWGYDEGPEFTLQASDALYELSLVYPRRVVSRDCWKQFDDGLTCPYTANGTPGFTTCPRDWAACQARGMDDWFGGIVARPQRVGMKQFSATSFGRSLSPLSLVNETIYGQTLTEVYTDTDMPVNCLIAAGRDESQYYAALGIVGAGPISSYSLDGLKHTLDGQSAHGPLPLGLRRSYGHDPVQDDDPDPDSHEFSLSEVGGGFTGDQAAGVAFIELRRTDEKGLQLSYASEHQMQAWVSGGIGGWTWSAPGSRSAATSLVNPVWIAVNALLRARGLQNGSAAEQEAVFDAASAVAAAAICELSVNRSDPLPGMTGTEPQFRFRGVIADQRPLRDWLQDILNNCLGYYCQSSGKLKFGIRVNSSVVEAFTIGNIVFGSLQLKAKRATFNSLTANFGNSEYEWQPDSVSLTDFDHASLIGGAYPQVLKSQINLSGCSSKSQAARIVITRLREELGGITAAEWLAARTISFNTTILGLGVEPGYVCSLTHDDMPGGAGEFRCKRWRLNGDWSITIEGDTTTDSMYSLVAGPKPADVAADPVPGERHERVLPPQPWFPYQEQPAASDPLFDETNWSFGLLQHYETLADGTSAARLRITGRYPITSLLAGDAPRVGSYAVSSTGGSIAAGKYVVVALTAIDANGNETRASQPVAIPVGVATSTNKVTLSGITWPAGTTGYRLYANEDHNIVSLQDEQTASQPSSIDVTAYTNYRTKGLPRPDLDALRVRVKVSEHVGVIGLACEAIGAGTITINGGAWTTDELAGRIVSFITDATDGSAAIWNFTVTSNTASVLTVTPDPEAAGVEAGDVMILRAMANIASSTTIGDSMSVNWVYPTGMAVNYETGRVVRIIAGTAVGHERRIASNDATTLTVDSPWTVVPDATSVYVIEQAAWEFTADAGRLAGEVIDGMLNFDVPVDNFLNRQLLVEVAAVTREGREPSRGYNPWREIYIYGDQGDFSGMLITATY